ncbi:two-component sensor histidine kinase [Streptomyces sp. 4503]|uniref:histidine kinase n=1 Tax=Streptomyces niphimycinicus TaxID=2842201 RepID=A0ABS6CID6_9ACTN|nr:histidine kinase [Streptomyces niphimycinicus]MBU3866581.1 two-component sensor histidine kinase [Streptomyces niphimycinicus]
MEPDTPLSPTARRIITVSLCGGLALVWLFDLATYYNPHGQWSNWLPLVSGPLAAAMLLFPDRRPGPEWRAGAATLGSLALTASLWANSPISNVFWSLLETVALLVLLTRTARRVERPAPAVALSAALGVAVIVLPLRTGTNFGVLQASFVLTFAVGGAVGLGCYLRLLDARRARAMDTVRHNERLVLARDLHDFIAHHVTGIIVHANAALMIQETSPEQIKPLLEGISRAGGETLDSMRRLVRVLREDDHQAARPGELLAELDRLVSAFAGHGTEARLDVGDRVRGVRLAPEVETSVHRVVQEALTNVRRHAPGADVAVRLDLDRHADGDQLRAEVHNTAASARATAPAGGRGGFGLVGLRERVEAVEGSLTSSRTADGGWCVTAVFPVLTAVEGSPA